MIKKLSRYGNSLAILIEKPVLELLNINEETELRITTDGNNILIEPLREGHDIPDDKKVEATSKKILSKYAPVLKKLADK